MKEIIEITSSIFIVTMSALSSGSPVALAEGEIFEDDVEEIKKPQKRVTGMK